MAASLTVEDLWPIVEKLPAAERARLVERLLSLDASWTLAELADLRDWAAWSDPGDAELLDPEGGQPFEWEPRR